MLGKVHHAHVDRYSCRNARLCLARKLGVLMRMSALGR